MICPSFPSENVHRRYHASWRGAENTHGQPFRRASNPDTVYRAETAPDEEDEVRESMAQRSYSSFAKRQKELARSEKRKTKLERRQKSKVEEGGTPETDAADGSLAAPDPEAAPPSDPEAGGEDDGDDAN
jgi:hypothetical protein